MGLATDLPSLSALTWSNIRSKFWALGSSAVTFSFLRPFLHGASGRAAAVRARGCVVQAAGLQPTAAARQGPGCECWQIGRPAPASAAAHLSSEW
jgi:hypothetical protein